jgi:hypothetical protein
MKFRDAKRKYEATMSVLSASGSIIFPNSDSMFIFLARYPSRKSVDEDTQKINNACRRKPQ